MVRPPPRGFFLVTAIVLFVCFVLFTRDHDRPVPHLQTPPTPQSAAADPPLLAPETQHAEPIMGKLGNETEKAELGRAAWKLFHTTMARFPDNPSQDESDALKSYIYLFARLYPCGECAQHFQEIIKKYPPQTSSRSTAAAWACYVHNEVNKSKDKPLFDCTNIGDFYDCGCADDEKDNHALGDKTKSALDGGKPSLDGLKEVEIDKEGPTRGG